jgi:pyruvate ferredoxin oxidoreductase gamma subunit
MFQVRFHGRGGQGVVTAAELLSVAAFLEGRHAQAFPSFGSERMGAPVVSFCRIADAPIRTREPVTEPDALIIQDPTLLHQAEVFAGFRRPGPGAPPGQGGYLLINTSRGFGQLGLGEFAGAFRSENLLTVPATKLALAHLGRPLPGAVLLGGLAALTGVIGLDAVVAAIEDRFSGKVAAGNAAAARAAFDYVVAQREELAGAQAN